MKNLTVQQIAAKLKAHPSTVYRWMNSGQLPFVRAGGKRTVAYEDFKSFCKVAAR